MDREPFATYRTYPRGLMADGFVDGKQYAYLSVTQAKHQIPIINDAHEARVKEAVKKAVEEFRKKVVAACRDPWRVCQLAICDQGSQYGRGWYEGQWYMQKACSNAVADIPAEPEEAKP